MVCEKSFKWGDVEKTHDEKKGMVKDWNNGEDVDIFDW